jgi:hypothetical protein
MSNHMIGDRSRTIVYYALCEMHREPTLLLARHLFQLERILHITKVMKVEI